MKFLNRFKHFLKEYRIVGISIGFVVAIAASNFFQAIVNDLILPILRPIISSESVVWEDLVLSVGSVNIRIGSLLSATLNLLIILILLYLFFDKLLHWKPKK